MPQSPFNLQVQNTQVEGRIVIALERIAQAFRVLLWSEGKTHALSPVQVQILIFLLYQPVERRTVSLLADAFNLTKATLSDSVKVLEKKRLVKRLPKQDLRSHTLELTTKGRELAMQSAVFTQEIQNPINKLSQAEKESMLLGLLDIIYHLNQQGIISIQRMCYSCMHYKANFKGHPHYCRLLNQQLRQADIRIDCPEYSSVFSA